MVSHIAGRVDAHGGDWQADHYPESGGERRETHRNVVSGQNYYQAHGRRRSPSQDA
jgi:hypothetical protein